MPDPTNTSNLWKIKTFNSTDESLKAIKLNENDEYEYVKKYGVQLMIINLTYNILTNYKLTNP